MITEIMRLLETKKEDMRNKKAGSIITAEPKTIWLKYADSPVRERDSILKDKLNVILEETLTKFKHTYILDVSPVMSMSINSDRNANFTNQGKANLWRYMNQTIKKFDR